MNIKERAKKLKMNIPTVYLSLKDKRTPILAKIVAALTIAYALSPIDLIPDFIPVLGYLDDVLLLPLLVAATVKLIPQEIWEENRSKAEAMWKDGRPKRWYYAIPIILIWLFIVWLVVSKVFL